METEQGSHNITEKVNFTNLINFVSNPHTTTAHGSDQTTDHPNPCEIHVSLCDMQPVQHHQHSCTKLHSRHFLHLPLMQKSTKVRVTYHHQIIFQPFITHPWQSPSLHNNRYSSLTKDLERYFKEGTQPKMSTTSDYFTHEIYEELIKPNTIPPTLSNTFLEISPINQVKEKRKLVEVDKK